MGPSELTIAAAKQRNVNDLAEHIRLLSLQSKQKDLPAPEAHFVDKSYSLFSLPLELRRNVYKYLFNSGATIVIDEDGSCSSATRMSTQLLRTCKAICEEFSSMLFSSCIITTNHPFYLAKGLKNIGQLPRRFVQQISITIPDEKTLSLYPHWSGRRRGEYPQQPPVYDEPFQHLSSLNTVTLRRLRSTSRVVDGVKVGDYVDAEKFVRCLLQSKPGKGNFLNEHMCLCTSGKDVTWNIELSARWFRFHGVLARKRPNSVQTKIHFEVKKATNDLGQPDRECWQFRDLGINAAEVTNAEGRGWVDYVTLWCRELHDPSAQWKPSKLKAPAQARNADVLLEAVYGKVNTDKVSSTA